MDFAPKHRVGVGRAVGVGIVVVIIVVAAGLGAYYVSTSSSSSSSTSQSSSSVAQTTSSTPASSSSFSSVTSSATSTSASTSTSTSTGAPASQTLVIDDFSWPSFDLNQLYAFEGLPYPNWLETVVYQPLVTVNETAEFSTGAVQFVPALASNWTESSNASVYTLNLRNDVHFSNGDPFNSYQVWTELYGQYYLSGNSSSWWVGGYNVFDMSKVNFGPQTIALLQQGGLITPSSAALAIMTNSSWPIYTTGPYQIVFHLKSPFLFFLNILTGWDGQMYDSQWLLQHGGFGTPAQINSYFNQNPIPGSGPYVVTQVAEGSYVKFAQDSNYWGRSLPQSAITTQPYFNAGYIKNVIVYAKTDDVARYTDLSTGAAQIANIEATDWNLVSANPQYSYLKLPPWLGQMYIMGMNTRIYPTNITAVRQAIVHAINYTNLSNEAYLGLASQFVGPTFPWFKNFYDLGNLPPYNYNLTLAEQYMKEANVTGTPTLVMRIYASCSACIDAAQVIQADLAQINLNVNIEVLTGGAYWGPIGTYNMMLNNPSPVGQLPLIGGGWAWAPNTISPTDNWVVFLSNSSLVDNDAIYSTPVVQACINAMLSSGNLSYIQSLCKQAQAQIYNDAPYAWLGIGEYGFPGGGSMVWKSSVIKSGFLVDPLWSGENTIPFFNTVQFA